MIDRTIQTFIQQAIQKQFIHPLDKIVRTNQLLALLQKEDFDDQCEPIEEATWLECLDELVQFGKNNGVIGETLWEKEKLEAQIMSLVTPLPSVLNQHFWEFYQESPKAATDYFYQLSQENNYIQTRAIAKNIAYPYSSPYGTIEITINLSKPEKDPKEIALAKLAKTANYPASQLTMTNEGYLGRSNHPARSNHRIVRLEVGGETWGFQYSPYAYFNEHAIFLSEEVRPMRLNEQSFRNLLSIIEQFPHYFVGSNADLPIVGGSILSHDHYQAGRHTFPIERAEILEEMSLPFEKVKAGIVRWPMSVIRVSSKEIEPLIEAANYIFECWKKYSDPSVDILCETNGERHHTITPIARKNAHNEFEMDLVLRNNRTSEEYPDGIFHPHKDVQHIKKENIGLIEVMGLAILPPRLKQELEDVAQFLMGHETVVEDIHREWANGLRDRQNLESIDQARHVVQEAVGEVFVRVLEDAGVFKQTKQGKEAFKRFVRYLELK